MKTSAAAKSAATVEAVAAAETSAGEAAAIAITRTASKSPVVSAETRASVITAAVVAAVTGVVGPTIVAASIIGPGPAVVAAAIVAVEPGTCANEDAVHKPVRAVVAVRGAAVGVVIIVAKIANGRRAVVDRAAADAHGDAHLRLRAAARNEKQQSE